MTQIFKLVGEADTRLAYQDDDGRWRFRWLRITDQDRVWVDRSGTEHLVADMDASYRANAARWLERMARGLHQQAIGRMARLLDDPLFGPHGDMATLEADRQFDWICGCTDQEWLETTPLYRALRGGDAAR